MTPNVIKFKIDGLPTDKAYQALPFGRQIEHRRKIEEFKAGANQTWLSIKRQSAATAWRKFRALYEPTQWFAEYQDGEFCRDDSFRVYYLSETSS